MSGRRYRRHRRNSFGSVVDDSVHIAGRFGPVGAMVTGVVGFAFFYAALPLTIMSWVEGRKALLTGPAAAAMAGVLDQVMWHRLIDPCQWAGIAILLGCSGIAAWKFLSDDGLTYDQLAGVGWVAKLVAKFLR
jgi:hypothetical protein